ncbi:MAG: response regulator transcription factor [Eubacteriales bacterium]|nr:response regulator transcription factor [Eubacteriales bacterium]
MYQILLVEDDKRIREVISDYFANQSELQIELQMVDNGAAAMDLLYENTYDLVLLDVMLPGISGFDICREIRRDDDVPIIFLTARGREEDILYGYDLGCDDYIVKPFSLATLQAKVKALLNRAKGTVLCEELTVGNISLNPRKMEVKVGTQIIELASKQYLILKLLMENKGVVVSRDTLIVRIWGYDYDGEERILDNHIKKLRQALGEEGKCVKTVIRKGYKIVD